MFLWILFVLWIWATVQQCFPQFIWVGVVLTCWEDLPLPPWHLGNPQDMLAALTSLDILHFVFRRLCFFSCPWCFSFIYLYLSLSIFISSTILPSWDCNIFTDFRFTSFVSGHTFVIRNRSRVATSLTGGSPITLTQLFVPQRRWNSLLHGYNRSQATSPPNHIIMNRYDSLWFIWFIWFITIHYDSLWFIVIHASCCISRPLQIAGDCINVITQRGAGPYVLSTHDSPRKRK